MMNWKEIKEKAKVTRKKPNDEEHRIQCACVEWFKIQYPGIKDALIAVPNGGRRDAVTGAKLKAEGVVSGVADLLLCVPMGDYGILAIEMKTSKGRQSESQMRWEELMFACSNKYVVCRSIDEFRKAVINYLGY